jgi:hypothetical protein
MVGALWLLLAPAFFAVEAEAPVAVNPTLRVTKPVMTRALRRTKVRRLVGVVFSAVVLAGMSCSLCDPQGASARSEET